jgi:hypothetical protein
LAHGERRRRRAIFGKGIVTFYAVILGFSGDGGMEGIDKFLEVELMGDVWI